MVTLLGLTTTPKSFKINKIHQVVWKRPIWKMNFPQLEKVRRQTKLDQGTVTPALPSTAKVIGSLRRGCGRGLQTRCAEDKMDRKDVLGSSYGISGQRIQEKGLPHPVHIMNAWLCSQKKWVVATSLEGLKRRLLMHIHKDRSVNGCQWISRFEGQSSSLALFDGTFLKTPDNVRNAFRNV